MSSHVYVNLKILSSTHKLFFGKHFSKAANYVVNFFFNFFFSVETKLRGNEREKFGGVRGSV